MVRVDTGKDESSPKLCFLTKWWRNCRDTITSYKQRVGFGAPGITAVRGWSVHPGKLSFLLELFYWYICLCMPMCVCRYCYGSFYIYNVITPCCYCCCIIRFSVGLAVQWFFSSKCSWSSVFCPRKEKVTLRELTAENRGEFWIPLLDTTLCLYPLLTSRRNQSSGFVSQPPLSVLFPVLIHLWCCVCLTCS